MKNEGTVLKDIFMICITRLFQLPIIQTIFHKENNLKWGKMNVITQLVIR